MSHIKLVYGTPPGEFNLDDLEVVDYDVELEKKDKIIKRFAKIAVAFICPVGKTNMLCINAKYKDNCIECWISYVEKEVSCE